MSATHKKTTIYRTAKLEDEVHKLYDLKLADWPVKFQNLFIDTKYGKVHVIACGPDTAKPVLLFHAASLSGLSWAENIEDLSKYYRLYAVDNPGEAGKSELKDINIFPDNGKKISELYSEISDKLNIKNSAVISASNGGYIALNYAYYAPERIKALVLLGPMGITPLANKSIFMMTIVSMYPFKFVRNYVSDWAIGDNYIVKEKYGDWFDLAMLSTFPAVAKPRPITSEQKRKMTMPVLLILGNKDNLVGNSETAKNTALEFPNIEIEITESGHLIGVEKSDFMNKRILEFFKKNYPYE
jgi:pimeloyl-ACP methyl ester carboxylesterase